MPTFKLKVDFQKGEVATAITIGALLLLGAVSLVSSYLLQKGRLKTKPRAASTSQIYAQEYTGNDKTFEGRPYVYFFITSKDGKDIVCFQQNRPKFNIDDGPKLESGSPWNAWEINGVCKDGWSFRFGAGKTNRPLPPGFIGDKTLCRIPSYDSVCIEKLNKIKSGGGNTSRPTPPAGSSTSSPPSAAGAGNTRKTWVENSCYRINAKFRPIKWVKEEGGKKEQTTGFLAWVEVETKDGRGGNAQLWANGRHVAGINALSGGRLVWGPEWTQNWAPGRSVPVAAISGGSTQVVYETDLDSCGAQRRLSVACTLTYTGLGKGTVSGQGCWCEGENCTVPPTPTPTHIPSSTPTKTPIGEASPTKLPTTSTPIPTGMGGSVIPTFPEEPTFTPVPTLEVESCKDLKNKEIMINKVKVNNSSGELEIQLNIDLQKLETEKCFLDVNSPTLRVGNRSIQLTRKGDFLILRLEPKDVDEIVGLLEEKNNFINIPICTEVSQPWGDTEEICTEEDSVKIKDLRLLKAEIEKIKNNYALMVNCSNFSSDFMGIEENKEFFIKLNNGNVECLKKRRLNIKVDKAYKKIFSSSSSSSGQLELLDFNSPEIISLILNPSTNTWPWPTRLKGNSTNLYIPVPNYPYILNFSYCSGKFDLKQEECKGKWKEAEKKVMFNYDLKKYLGEKSNYNLFTYFEIKNISPLPYNNESLDLLIRKRSSSSEWRNLGSIVNRVLRVENVALKQALGLVNGGVVEVELRLRSENTGVESEPVSLTLDLGKPGRYTVEKFEFKDLAKNLELNLITYVDSNMDYSFREDERVTDAYTLFINNKSRQVSCKASQKECKVSLQKKFESSYIPSEIAVQSTLFYLLNKDYPSLIEDSIKTFKVGGQAIFRIERRCEVAKNEGDEETQIFLSCSDKGEINEGIAGGPVAAACKEENWERFVSDLQKDNIPSSIVFPECDSVMCLMGDEGTYGYNVIYKKPQVSNSSLQCVNQTTQGVHFVIQNISSKVINATVIIKRKAGKWDIWPDPDVKRSVDNVEPGEERVEAFYNDSNQFRCNDYDDKYYIHKLCISYNYGQDGDEYRKYIYDDSLSKDSKLIGCNQEKGSVYFYVIVDDRFLDINSGGWVKGSCKF